MQSILTASRDSHSAEGDKEARLRTASTASLDAQVVSVSASVSTFAANLAPLPTIDSDDELDSPSPVHITRPDSPATIKAKEITAEITKLDEAIAAELKPLTERAGSGAGAESSMAPIEAFTHRINSREKALRQLIDPAYALNPEQVTDRLKLFGKAVNEPADLTNLADNPQINPDNLPQAVPVDQLLSRLSQNSYDSLKIKQLRKVLQNAKGSTWPAFNERLAARLTLPPYLRELCSDLALSDAEVLERLQQIEQLRTTTDKTQEQIRKDTLKADQYSKDLLRESSQARADQIMVVAAAHDQLSYYMMNFPKTRYPQGTLHELRAADNRNLLQIAAANLAFNNMAFILIKGIDPNATEDNKPTAIHLFMQALQVLPQERFTDAMKNNIKNMLNLFKRFKAEVNMEELIACSDEIKDCAHEKYPIPQYIPTAKRPVAALQPAVVAEPIAVVSTSDTSVTVPTPAAAPVVTTPPPATVTVISSMASIATIQEPASPLAGEPSATSAATPTNVTSTLFQQAAVEIVPTVPIAPTRSWWQALCCRL